MTQRSRLKYLKAWGALLVVSAPLFFLEARAAEEPNVEIRWQGVPGVEPVLDLTVVASQNPWDPPRESGKRLPILDLTLTNSARDPLLLETDNPEAPVFIPRGESHLKVPIHQAKVTLTFANQIQSGSTEKAGPSGSRGPLRIQRRSLYEIEIKDWRRIWKRFGGGRFRVPVTRRPSYSMKLYELKPTTFSISFGTTFLGLQETNQLDFTQVASTAKFSILQSLDPILGWERGSLGISFYGNLFPYTSNQAGKSARCFGGNFRIGYRTNWLKEPLTLSLMAGYYYATLNPNQGSFGYSNLMGPQLYPTLRYQLSDVDYLSSYFKISFMGDGLVIRSAENREIAFGLSWSHFFENDSPISVGMDVAQLRLVSSTYTLQSNSFSFDIGYGF